MSSTVAITNFPSYAAVVGVAGTIVLPLLAQATKKFPRLNIGAVIHTLVVLFAALMALAQYGLQLHAKPSLIVPGISGLSIYALSQLVYKYGIYAQPLLNKASAFFSKSTPAASNTADQAVAAVTAPAEIATEPTPAAPESNGFNA